MGGCESFFVKRCPLRLQVRVDPGIPAKILGVKPKFWLTATVAVGAGQIVKIPAS